MVVMQLQERSRLSIQDPICKYLSPCPESWKPVTIHHLLTHTSGIPSFTDLSDYAPKMMIPTAKEEMIARFRDLPLEFPPGEKFKYNNSGYFLLGLIIEKITGKAYEDVVRGQILEPLGMRSTGYDHSKAIIKGRAAGYVPSADGLANAAYLDMAQPYAAGALYSTVEDLLLWDQALYTEKLVHRSALDAMFTPFKGGYAYGWAIRTASPATFGRKQIAHGGGINGFATFIARYPDEKATVIVLCNNEAFPAGSVATDLAAILFDAKYEIPIAHKLAKVDPRIYDS
jgi:CubicO group peptidase (beta-lactamase class C family)